MATTLEARLQYLETREEANTRDILRLKSENVELRTKIHEMTGEHAQVLMKLKEMDTKFQKLENDLKEVFGFRESLNEQLRNLDSKINRTQDNEDRVSILETGINEARQEITQYSQSMAARLDALDGNGIPQNSVNEEIESRIKALEDIRAQYAQSVVNVEVKPARWIKTNKTIKLDKCLDTYQESPSFDGTSCTVNPQVDGDYLVCAVLCQKGEGEIDLYGRIDVKDGNYYMGTTDSSISDIMCCSRVISLKKGETFSLIVERVKGNAYVDWCELYVHLV